MANKRLTQIQAMDYEVLRVQNAALIKYLDTALDALKRLNQHNYCPTGCWIDEAEELLNKAGA